MLDLAKEPIVSVVTDVYSANLCTSHFFILILIFDQIDDTFLEYKPENIITHTNNTEIKVLINGDYHLCMDLIDKIKSSQGYINQIHIDEEKNLNNINNSDLIISAYKNFNHSTIIDLYSIEKIRQRNLPPLFLLIDQLCEKSQLQALQHGYDNIYRYDLTIEEFLLRIRNQIIYKQENNEKESDNNILSVGNLILQKKDRIVSFNERKTSLTRVQFRLLWVLCQNKGKIISRQNLYERALEKSLEDFDRSLDMQICRIRKKLNEIGFSTDQISCIRGKGYQFSLDYITEKNTDYG